VERLHPTHRPTKRFGVPRIHASTRETGSLKNKVSELGNRDADRASDRGWFHELAESLNNRERTAEREGAPTHPRCHTGERVRGHRTKTARAAHDWPDHRPTCRGHWLRDDWTARNNRKVR
jgi:hypothetical protein